MEIYCKSCDKVLGNYPDEKIPPGVKGYTTCKLCGEKITIYRERRSASSPPAKGKEAKEEETNAAPHLSDKKDWGIKRADVLTVLLLILTTIATVVLAKPDFDLSKRFPKNMAFEPTGEISEDGIYEVQRNPEELPLFSGAKETISLNDIDNIRNKLIEGRFEELNDQLATYQEALDKDPLDEYKVYDAYRTFFKCDKSLEEPLKAWQRTFPDHYQPHLAMAAFYFGRGWETRGYRYAGDTSEEQFEMMRTYFLKSEQNLKTALHIKPNLLTAHWIMIGLSNASSVGGNENDAIEKAIQLFPLSYIIRSMAMWAKEPRWGGSFRAMERIAREAEKYAEVNPKLSSLYGEIYLYQGENLRRKNKLDEALKIYSKALSYGDNSKIYKERADIYFENKKYHLALENINKSIGLSPVTLDFYILRSNIYYALSKDKEAISDLSKAVIIKPYSVEYDKEFNKYNIDMLSALKGGKFNKQSKGVNWLFNSKADEGMKGWYPYGCASYKKNSQGNNIFYTCKGNHMIQEVYIPRGTGWYALYIGRASINRTKDELGKTQLPNIHSYMLEDNHIKTDVWGQQMDKEHFEKNYNNDWLPMWGVYKIHNSAYKIRFFLDQSEMPNRTGGDAEAYFDDLGLFFFQTEEEAELFAKNYFKKFGTTSLNSIEKTSQQDWVNMQHYTLTQKKRDLKTSSLFISGKDGSVQQVSFDNRLLAGTDNGWEHIKLNDHIYHIKFGKWKSTFLKIDTKIKKVTKVTNGQFGKRGGKESYIPYLHFSIFGKSNQFSIFNTSTIFKFMPEQKKLQILWGGEVIIDEQFFYINRLSEDIFHFKRKRTNNVFYKIDIKKKQLYAIRNGKFGHSGGNETLIMSIDVI